LERARSAQGAGMAPRDAAAVRRRPSRRARAFGRHDVTRRLAMSEVDRNVGEQKLNWSKLDQMSDQGLATLVDSAIFVLKQSEVGGGPAPTEMPASVMTKALEQLLAERGADSGAAVKVVKQAELSRPVALALLSTIATEPALAQEIERVWRERGG